MATKQQHQINGQSEIDDLEKDLVDLDGDESLIAGLSDTPIQQVSNPMNAWIRLDNVRSQRSYELQVAKKMRDQKSAKTCAEELVKTREEMVQVTRDLLKALAEHEKVREHVPNWVRWPVNIRPILKKHLKSQYQIDVSDIIAQAEEMESERGSMQALEK